MEQTEDWISLREFAKRVGVQVKAVQDAIANSRIVRRTSDKKIHWPSQSKAWDEYRDLSKVRDDEPIDDESVSSFREAKARREMATAQLKELELQKALGELVDAGHVRRAVSQKMADIREGVMSIPIRVSSEMAASLKELGVFLDPDLLQALALKLWSKESRAILQEIARGTGNG